MTCCDIVSFQRKFRASGYRVSVQPKRLQEPTHLVNLAITNTRSGGARPPVVQRSEGDGLDCTGSRGPEGRASRASERRKAATEVKRQLVSLTESQLM